MSLLGASLDGGFVVVSVVGNCATIGGIRQGGVHDLVVRVFCPRASEGEGTFLVILAIESDGEVAVFGDHFVLGTAHKSQRLQDVGGVGLAVADHQLEVASIRVELLAGAQDVFKSDGLGGLAVHSQCLRGVLQQVLHVSGVEVDVPGDAIGVRAEVCSHLAKAHVEVITRNAGDFAAGKVNSGLLTVDYKVNGGAFVLTEHLEHGPA